MNNYYETCLTEIRQAISDNKLSDALRILDEELAMPYVPSPYNETFVSLRDSIRIDTSPQSKYFEDIDDIENALRGNDALKLKAIISLERMNLRVYLEEIQQLLSDITIDDWMKRQILIFLIDQDINQEIRVSIIGQHVTLNPKNLMNPIGSKEYLETLNYLEDKLESDNPSLLMLCVAELDQLTLENFPIGNTKIDGELIISRVSEYLNAV